MKWSVLLLITFCLLTINTFAVRIEKAKLDKYSYKIGERFRLNYNLSFNNANRTKYYKVKYKISFGGEKYIGSKDFTLRANSGISGESFYNSIQVVDKRYGQPSKGYIKIELYEVYSEVKGNTTYRNEKNLTLLDQKTISFIILINQYGSIKMGVCDDGFCRVCFYPGIQSVYEVCYNVKNWHLMIELHNQNREVPKCSLYNSNMQGYLWMFRLNYIDHYISSNGSVWAWKQSNAYSKSFTTVGYVMDLK